MKSEYKTKSRSAILDFLKEHADTRFTARSIADALEDDGFTINRSTIYRNIDRLCEEGKLVSYKENDTNGTCYQYSEGHGSCHEHMHAQCIMCGKIFHLSNEIATDFEDRLKNDYGFQIDYGHTIIKGLCDECQN